LTWLRKNGVPKDPERKPTKKALLVFLIAWGAVVCFIVLVFVWNGQR